MKKDPFEKKQKQFTKQIDAELDRFSMELADELAEEESHKPHALPKKAQKERWKMQIDKSIADFQHRMEEGTSLLLKTLMTLSKEKPELFSSEVKKGLTSLLDYTINLIDHPPEQIQGLEEGVSLQELCGMNDATIEALYQAAKYLFEHEQYEEKVS